METTRAKPIRVLIADDHPLFREALRKLLESDPQVRVVGEAGDGSAAVRLSRELRPDVVLLDVCMPGPAGPDVLRDLSTVTPPVRTLLLTAEMADFDLVEALRLGARGVVFKQSASDLLFKGIRGVMAGEYWVRRECVGNLVDRIRERPAGAAPSRLAFGTAPFGRTFGLTPREMEVVATVVAGYRNEDIARKLCISTKTVKHHLTNIFAKLGISNRLELALFATEQGLHPAL